jgi:hypothetical protein
MFLFYLLTYSDVFLLSHRLMLVNAVRQFMGDNHNTLASLLLKNKPI